MKKCPYHYGLGTVAECELVSSAVHECAECGFKVAHTGWAILNHLRGKHRMTPHAYAWKHRVRLGLAKDEVVAGDVAEAGKAHEEWLTGCEYRCAECDFTANVANLVAKHLKTQHGRLIANKKEGNGIVVVREDKVVCAICSVSMLKSASYMRGHLTRAHKMGLEEYTEKYFKGSENNNGE